MAILAECPYCHRKQSVRNKGCGCGADLDRFKKSKKVRYWISYYLPGGKQRREAVGYSIEEARDAEGKRRGQKREGRIFDIKADIKTTFAELSKWYLGLSKVKALASSSTVRVYLKKFNNEYGNKIIAHIKLVDLENLQEKRKREGLKAKTIDDEINYVKSMIIKAWDNDLISSDTLKTFKRIRPMLRRYSNARDRILSVCEYQSLLDASLRHLKNILVTGYWTGMRKGEILKLTWDKVNLKERIISLDADDTKEGKAKTIPIGATLYKILNKIPVAIHDPHVFLYYGKPIKHFTTALKAACKEAGIEWGERNQRRVYFP